MNKTHKKMLGFVGLGMVAAITTFAATLPTPEASAIQSSVTDTIQVRVIPSYPDLELITDSGAVITTPEYNFTANYTKLGEARITITNRNADGVVVYSGTYWEGDLGFEQGTRDFSVNFDDFGGRGYFTIDFYAIGDDNVPVERFLTVQYSEEQGTDDGGSGETSEDEIKVGVEVPLAETKTITAEVYDQNGALVKTVQINDPTDVQRIDLAGVPDGYYNLVVTNRDADGFSIKTTSESIIVESGTPYVDINVAQTVDVVTTIDATIYDSENNEIRKIVANRATDNVDVYDTNGNLLFSIPNGYTESGTQGMITISLRGLPYSDYNILFDFRSENGRLIGNSIAYKLKYVSEGIIVVPDTGGFFQGLNISREDYLITGLVVFLIIGVVAFGIVAKKKSNKKQSKRERK
ncbi:MAG: hypothetical protein Q4B87_00190 [Candidatus Saccharibacteria bacterium]|nr:hypothetical protein [Candidatus Saccharibacteria bacterium]